MKKFYQILKENKLLFYSLGMLLLIIIISETFVFLYFYQEINKEKSNEQFVLEKEEEKLEKIEQKVVVDIKGEINSPGTYEIEQNKRVIDVIKLAKGLTKNADTSVNNLSKYVSDEMVINIYSKQQVKDFLKVKEQESIINKKCNEESLSNNNSCLSNQSNIKEDNTLISINNATKEQLLTLPGIGESKANLIIEYRKQQPFINIEDIKNVSGIGENLYAQIKSFITT